MHERVSRFASSERAIYNAKAADLGKGRRWLWLVLSALAIGETLARHQIIAGAGATV